MTSPSPTRARPAGAVPAERHGRPGAVPPPPGRQVGRPTPDPVGAPAGARPADRPTATPLALLVFGSVALAAVAALGLAAFVVASVSGLVIVLTGCLLGGAAALSASAVLPAGRAERAPADGVGGGRDDGGEDDAAGRALLDEANRVLSVLHELSRSLPTNLDLDEVLVAIRSQLVGLFGAERLAILTVDDHRWYPVMAEQLELGPAKVLDDLPAPLDRAVLEPSVLRVDDLSALCERTGSGLYGRLIVDGIDQGLLVVEHPEPGRFDDRTAELFDGVCELVAIGIDNARSFGRLRSLAAAEERARIARDLHDRLGQWLTYINLELERINGSFQPPDPQLDRLQSDVRAAIDELRDALVDLRTTIRPGRPLSLVLLEVVQRFSERTGLRVELSVPDPSADRLSTVVENEMLRIVQESLTNIEKHADATVVHINWSVDGGRGVLTIGDDGRGFDPSRGARSTAYGLVGMRERAAAVGAILEIASQRGAGTVITVLVGTTEETHP